MEFNGTSIMALSPASGEANELTSWLEKGAFEAIKQKYLERLVLVIFEGDPNGKDATVIEEHSFSVRYPEESDCSGKHALELHSKDLTRGKKAKEQDLPGSKSAVKKECVPASRASQAMSMSFARARLRASAELLTP
jgi:hypothetical protein